MMRKGSSVKWSKVLKDFTDGRSDQLDPVPMLEYFKPLHKWLLKQNLTLTNWDCDKYIDKRRRLVRAYHEQLDSSNNFDEISKASKPNKSLLNEVSLLFCLFSLTVFVQKMYI